MQRPKFYIPGLKFEKDGVISHPIAYFQGCVGRGVGSGFYTVFHSKYGKPLLEQNM